MGGVRSDTKIAGAVYYGGEDAFDLSLCFSHGRFSWIALHGQGREMRISRHRQHWSGNKFRTFMFKLVTITRNQDLSIPKIIQVMQHPPAALFYVLMLSLPHLLRSTRRPLEFFDSLQTSGNERRPRCRIH